MNDLPTGTVTFLFTDIEGSTTRWEQQRRAMQIALAQHDAILRSVIEHNGGAVFKTVGDAFYAVFASAPDALNAAHSAQHALDAEVWDSAIGALRVRMALHTGTPQARGDDYFGPPLNRVARLLGAGNGGQILLSAATQELVRDHLPPGTTLRDLGEHRLKDLIRPEHIFQLSAPGLPAEFAALRSLDARPHNLPVQRDPLIGREREVAEVGALLRRPEIGLVTLTGPGGTGKTRLSQQVAADLLDDFVHGVWFVELAAITDPALVTAAVAQTLGVTEVAGQPLIDQLKADLRGKHLLLVLDNYEQVVSAGALAAELLTAAVRLKVLVTSREVLHLSGEQEYPVPPLALPKLQEPLDRLTQYAAVQLFIHRAQAARPDFQITNDTAAAVAEICIRLDGLPLAIELAAARIKVLPPAALLARLDNRLKLLTGGARDRTARQQTLRGAIDWSYHLLDTAEQILFARLAVFAGGCTVEAAEAVCNAAGDLDRDVLDGLASLVDKSLLRQADGPDVEPRFIMLETIREYAWERLRATHTAEQVQTDQAAYYLELVETLEPEADGAQQARWLQRMEVEHDNVRAVLDWALKVGSFELGLRMIGALREFWGMHGHFSEGRAWCERALAHATDLPAAVQAKAFSTAGFLAYAQGDYTAAHAYYAQSLQFYQDVGDKRGSAEVQKSFGNLASQQGNYALAQAHYADSMVLYHDLGDQQRIADLLNNRGVIATRQGDAPAARTHYEQSLALYRELNNKHGIAVALNNLGGHAEAQRDYAIAQALYQESLALKRELGDRYGMAASLNNLGNLADEQGDIRAARALYQESLALKRELGDKHGTAMSLNNLGNLAQSEHDYVTAQALQQEALALRHELGDRHGLAISLNNLGDLALEQGDTATAQALHQEGLSLSRALGDKHAIAMALNNLGRLAAADGADAAARAFFEEQLAIARELGDEEGIAKACSNLDTLATEQ